MEVLICLTCSTIFNKKKLRQPYNSKCYFCPKLTRCGGSLIEVDEGLADIILKLNRSGARTIYSCFGHLPDNSHLNKPFVMFYSPNKGKRVSFENLRNLILELVKNTNSDIEVTNIDVLNNVEIPRTGGVRGDLKRFIVTYNRWSYDVLERITEQHTFLKFLYLLVDELQERK